MVYPTNENYPYLKLYRAYAQYDKLIAETKWWQFLKRWRLKDELALIKQEAFSAGIRIALKDLETAGIIERVE